MKSPIDPIPDDLLIQATGRILIGGKVKGTAWLVSDNGHLLTAGHLLGGDLPLDEIEVRFSEDVPLKAHNIQWGYQQAMGIDFAVLKLNEHPTGRYPLPIMLSKEVSGTFRACGYGVDLMDLSFGKGEFVGSFDPQNSSGYRLFKLDSKELGQGGYSGAAIISDELQAVIAIQIEATTAKIGAERDTVLAMPLYRVARYWEPLIEEAEKVSSRRQFPGQVHKGSNKKLDTLREENWLSLLRSIKAGKCTPFLGYRIYSDVLPNKRDIAQRWAQKYGYPLGNPLRLSQVAQFLSMQVDFMFPRDEITEIINKINLADLARLEELHRILADLPLPVYITTNYDDFMTQVLNNHGYKEPIQELCRWNEFVVNLPSIFEEQPGFRPTYKKPIVFHLYGCIRHQSVAVPESLVLTEDDYLNFLVEVSKNENLLPARIQESLAGTSLLFMGYQITDWDFRVLLHIVSGYLKQSLHRTHVSVQLVPGDTEFSDHIKAQEYLNKYFGDRDIRVYWGTYRDFVKELEHRWRDFSDAG